MRKLSMGKGKVQFFVSGFPQEYWPSGKDVPHHPMAETPEKAFDKAEGGLPDYSTWKNGSHYWHVYACVDRKVLWEVFPLEKA